MRGEGWREREGNGRMGNDEIYRVDRGIPSCFNYRSRVAFSDFLFLFFFFRSTVDDNRKDWKDCKRLSSTSFFFFLKLDLSFLHIEDIQIDKKDFEITSKDI